MVVRLGWTMGCCSPNPYVIVVSLGSYSRVTITGSEKVIGVSVSISFVCIPDSSVELGLFGELLRDGLGPLDRCSTKNTSESVELN